MSVILTDIEGTTSSIAFVKDELFPFARRRLPGFVAEQGNRPAIRALLDEARALAGQPDLDDQGVAALLVSWIDQDRKAPPLKALQGLIWAAGYQDGRLRGHVYDDAADALARWQAQGYRLYVYSSGSVEAQKLIFGFSRRGDLTPLFSGYFDTRTGPKLESPSYTRIAAEIGVPARDILFLSDHAGELDAARAAGLRTARLARPEDGNDSAAARAQAGPHPVYSSFADVAVE